jgi:hypothetical protein
MTQSLSASVAAEIRAEMARQGVSQTKLSEVLGRSQAYVSRRLVEAPEVPFHLADLECIAQHLGVPMAHFLPVDAARPRRTRAGAR